jgi:site-specific DNA-methyltransferase (adenine-specific)/adenine-specific DNA-methyltransferase
MRLYAVPRIDEPRKEKQEDEELEIDIGGRQAKGWTNKLIWGDNKLILSSLKSGALRRQIEDAGGLKLIYIDPPFDVGADFSMDKRESLHHRCEHAGARQSICPLPR